MSYLISCALWPAQPGQSQFCWWCCWGQAWLASTWDVQVCKHPWGGWGSITYSLYFQRFCTFCFGNQRWGWTVTVSFLWSSLYQNLTVSQPLCNFVFMEWCSKWLSSSHQVSHKTVHQPPNLSGFLAGLWDEGVFTAKFLPVPLLYQHQSLRCVNNVPHKQKSCCVTTTVVLLTSHYL